MVETGRQGLISFDLAMTGVRTIDGGGFTIISADVGANELTFIGGTGQTAMIDTETGVITLNPVVWAGEVVSGGDIPITDGNIVATINSDGDVEFIFNNNESLPSKEQFIEFIMVGQVTMSGGNIIQANTGYNPLYGLHYKYQNLIRALGNFNFATDGFIVEGNTDSTFRVNPGSAFGFFAGVLDDPRFPDIITSDTLVNPASFVVHVSPRTGQFAFSAGGLAEVDLYEAIGDITVFADDGAGGTRVTSTAHPIKVSDVGKSITIDNTTNYNSTFTITNRADANRFDIDTPFVGDDGTGDWRATIDVAVGSFSNQRWLLFARGPIIAEYLGLEQYTTQAAARAAFPLEIFTEPALTATANKQWDVSVKQGITDISMDNPDDILYIPVTRLK